MTPKPEAETPHHVGTGKLADKVAIITGGDSGIGRAVAIAFAKEGAKVVVSYLNEHDDANETKDLVEKEGGECLLIAGDIGKDAVCQKIVKKAVGEFGRVDVVVNNAAEQHPTEDFLKISEKQLERTFRTNIFSFFFLTKAALRHLKK